MKLVLMILLAGTYYDQIVAALGDDSEEILRFLNSLDNDTLYELTSVFGELSLKFDTQEFADELLRLEATATQAVMQ